MGKVLANIIIRCCIHNLTRCYSIITGETMTYISGVVFPPLAWSPLWFSQCPLTPLTSPPLFG